MKTTINWIPVSERLPEIKPEEVVGGREVLTAWGFGNMTTMRYVTRNIRGKQVERFEWQGRISPFTVKWWAEMPEHPDAILAKPPCDHYYAEAFGIKVCIHCKEEG